MSDCGIENFSYVRPFCVLRADCVFAYGEINVSICLQINDHFGLTQKCVDMPGQMVTVVDDKQNAATCSEPRRGV